MDHDFDNNHFFEFKRKFLDFGISRGMWTEEDRRNILDRAPTQEEEHDAKIMDKMLLEHYMCIMLENHGHIDEDKGKKLCSKITRKYGFCAQCPKFGDLRCAKCKQVHYCSKACQKAHWKTHKKECKKIREAMGA